jgi:phage terminase large subunit GpA-like protein
MLLWKRLSNMGQQAFIYICGTPTIKGASPTEDLYNQSDMMLYMLPCPQCKTMQFLDKERVDWAGKKEGENEQPKTGYFSCIKKNCKGKFTQGTLFKAYYEKKSKWVATRESDSDIAGFHINQFYSPWRRWDDIVKEIIDARGQPTKEKVIENTVWGLPYELSSIQTPDWQKIYNLKSDFRRGVVPAEACVITAFTDVQEDRFETTIVAWYKNHSWVVDHIITPGCSVWDLDDEMYDLYEKTILEYSWPHAGGKKLKPRHFYMDVGFFTSRLLKFCQKHKGKLHPTRGDDRLDGTFSPPKKTSINFRGRRLKMGIKRWNLGVSNIKLDLYATLNRLIEREGDEQKEALKIFFNKDLSEEYFKQITAEVCYVEHNQFGRPKYSWIKEKYYANETLDCMVGNMAAFEIEGYNRWSDELWEAEMKKLWPGKTATKKPKGKKAFAMV